MKRGIGMFDYRKITFDCYYTNYEQPIQLWIFDAAKKNGCKILKVKVTGVAVRHYKVFLRADKESYLNFVEYFISKAGKMVDFLSY